jgi:hypothetical protein
MRVTRFDRALKVYPVTRAPNGEGIMVPTLGTAVSFQGDLQPVSKTASRRVQFGLDSTEAKGKVLFYDNWITIQEGSIVEDVSDGEKYLVNGPPAKWNGHSEVVLVEYNG